ncbi:MAG: hypothetical protein WA694_22365, partial [Pseudolabrys sp.]
LVGAPIIRGFVHRPELEVAFTARLGKMLTGQFRFRVAPRASLHSVFFVRRLATPRIQAIDFALDRSFQASSLLRLYAKARFAGLCLRTAA